MKTLACTHLEMLLLLLVVEGGDGDGEGAVYNSNRNEIVMHIEIIKFPNY